MARFSGPAEMEMEMEMEMDAGPSIPFPMGSPVRRPIGVSPTVPAEDGELLLWQQVAARAWFGNGA